MKNTEYIQQDKYPACFLIALLNARIYHNKPYPVEMKSLKWEKMIDEYGCRYGSCINRKQATEDLDLDLIPIDRDNIPNKLPAMITSFTKVGFHSSLVIDTDKDKWTIINYDGRKETLCQIINKKDIKFPRKGNINDKHYHIECRKDMIKGYRFKIWVNMILLWIYLCIILFIC